MIAKLFLGLIENIRHCLCWARDFFIPFLPKAIVRLLIRKIDFAFLAHPIDLSDLSKRYTFLGSFAKRMQKAVSRYSWPVVGPKVSGFRDKNGKEIRGRVIFCPLTPRIMLLKKDIAKQRIVQTARFAEKLGAECIGLGAFIPILTDHGRYLVDKVKANITAGDAFAAITAVKNIQQVSEQLAVNGQKDILAVVGAAGYVGSAATLMLAERFDRLMLVDINKEGARRLAAKLTEIYKDKKEVIVSEKTIDISAASVVLTVTNAPGAIIRSEYVKPGSVIVDAATPRNVSTKLSRRRDDILVIESGILEVAGLKAHFDFGQGILRENEVFSCLAEALALVWSGKQGKFVGEVNMEYVNMLEKTMGAAGIKIPPYRNSKGFIPAEEIVKFKKLKQQATGRAGHA